MIVFDFDKCAGFDCLDCINSCPEGILKFDLYSNTAIPYDLIQVDPEKCAVCETCVDVCTNGAITDVFLEINPLGKLNEFIKELEKKGELDYE